MEYSAPNECGLSKLVVDDWAGKIADHLSYHPGSPLEPIVTKLGGRLRVLDILESQSIPAGSIRINGMNDFDIYLAAHTGPTRDRFTIAHELGHYFLHYVYPNQTGHSVERLEALRYGTGRVEWEANWFAAGFLMPAKIFRERWAKDKSATLLADAFGVSFEAASIRVSALNLS